MKYYSAKKIREYIETHKDEIKAVGYDWVEE